MPILSEGYITSQDLIKYVRERHNRHWSKGYLSVLIKKGVFPVRDKIGRRNIFNIKDIDNYISTIKRLCSSGKRGVKYKI